LSVLLFAHNRAVDSDLSRFVVDDNIVRVRNRLRPINTPTVILGKDSCPVFFAFDCCAKKLRGCGTAVSFGAQYEI
jgi:hypothetical protein